MQSKNKVNLDNSGTNYGNMIGQVNGDLHMHLQTSVKLPSRIAFIVKTLGNNCIPTETENFQFPCEFKPEEKLSYNCVNQYKDLIREYSAYYTLCDDTMNCYDNSNVSSKKRILLWVKTHYLQLKGEIVKSKEKNESDIDAIRRNADLLIEKVIQRLKETIIQSSDGIDIFQEDLELGIYCFICYCFMECKILEKPE